MTNQGAGQNIYGDSRPDQVDPSGVNQFWSGALSGLTTNPSFPSGHTTYVYTDSILLAMLVPQDYQSMLARAAQYANSRIVIGVHYPLDIIASRALASYDLAQAFSNPAYNNNAATTGTAIDLPALFNAAQPELQGYLSSQCGDTVAACSTSTANTKNDPLVSPSELATYTADLTYGLPTLSFADAPREAAPTDGPDAAILLATIYGGNSAAALAIAPTGGIDGDLATSTIDQIIVNTETNALAAFYGTDLSYWTRLNLFAASVYFQDVTGTLTLAPTDVLTTNVTVGSGGLLYANGTIDGNVEITSGGAWSAGSATAPGTVRVFGSLTFDPNSTYDVEATPTGASATDVSGAAQLNGAVDVVAGSGRFAPNQQYDIVEALGGVSGTFTGVTSDLAFLSPSLSYDGNAGLGTDSETGNFYGGELGIDYLLQPNWLVGVALGGSDSHFNVGDVDTSGPVSGFHIGVYSAANFGNGFYAEGSSSFSNFWNHASRYVEPIAALDGAQENGAFESREFRERLEVGRRFDFGGYGITPFAALEVAALNSDGFTETSDGSLGNPALSVGSQTLLSVPAFVGGRFDGHFQVGNGWLLTPILSLAYVHEFSPIRDITADLVALPGESFLVNGARPAYDSVQVKPGFQLALGNGVSLYGDFDGEFSGVSRYYTGHGGIKVSW